MCLKHINPVLLFALLYFKMQIDTTPNFNLFDDKAIYVQFNHSNMNVLNTHYYTFKPLSNAALQAVSLMSV